MVKMGRHNFKQSVQCTVHHCFLPLLGFYDCQLQSQSETKQLNISILLGTMGLVSCPDLLLAGTIFSNQLCSDFLHLNCIFGKVKYLILILILFQRVEPTTMPVKGWLYRIKTSTTPRSTAWLSASQTRILYARYVELEVLTLNLILNADKFYVESSSVAP